MLACWLVDHTDRRKIASSYRDPTFLHTSYILQPTPMTMTPPPELGGRDLFLSACERNDVNSVRHLLPHGADVNCRKDNDGLSGLHIAARDNYGDLLELLLNQTGVDVNITTKNSAKPLMLACFCGHDDIVRRLCQVTDIELNCRTLQNLTALHGAVVRNHLGCVKVLRDAEGVDWNVREACGWYPLTWSVDRGLADILQIILSVPEPRLDVSLTDPRGRNIAQMGVESRAGERQRCVELLCLDDRVDWNIQNPAGDSPLLHCLKNNKTTMAVTLLNNPAVDLDLEDRDGRHVEDIARSVLRHFFKKIKSSFDVSLSQVEEHDRDIVCTADLHLGQTEDDCEGSQPGPGFSQSAESLQGRRVAGPHQDQHPGETGPASGGQAGAQHHQAGQGSSAGFLTQ